jgi:ADP-ribose pyrophosphatase
MISDRFRFRGRFLGIVEREGWEFATRTNASDVAVMVPVTDQGDVVLIEQYRIPVNARVIELPAGLVGDQDDPDEPVLEAAHRELVEETGYAASRLSLLLQCPSSSGMSDEIVTFFLAEGLHKVGPGGGDESEEILVHEVPLTRACEWLGARHAEGYMLDPKVYAALLWLERRARGEAPCP